MSRWPIALSLFVACACAGSPEKPPESAADEAASPPNSEPESSSPKADADEKPEAPKAASQPASPDDARQVLQLVIDDEALEPYLHLDKPDRFPLRIAGSVLPQGIELTKATKPVVIVADPDSEKKPVIVFTELTIDGDQASVRYRYDVEKVRGSSTLKRRDGRWILSRSRVTEH